MANAHANHDFPNVESADPTPPDAFLTPVQITSAPTVDGSPATTPVDTPPGVASGASDDVAATTPADVAQGIGIEGETVVWDGAYSMRNFLGRLFVRGLLTVGLIGLAVATWGFGYDDLLPVTLLAAAFVGALWAALIWRMTQARYGHAYQLTNRRLFVSTGLMRRRHDQMELIRVHDVFLRQTLMERWMGLGTVVVVSSEKLVPTFYLAGVEDPQRVMDLVWHHARAERDRDTTQVASV